MEQQLGWRLKDSAGKVVASGETTLREDGTYDYVLPDLPLGEYRFEMDPIDYFGCQTYTDPRVPEGQLLISSKGKLTVLKNIES